MSAAHLPIFPTFHAKPTEGDLETVAERLMDRADKALMQGSVTQGEYDRWTRALDAWVKRNW